MAKRLAVLPGDGIGPEIMDEAVKILEWITETDGALDLEWEKYPVGGASIDEFDTPLRSEVLEEVQSASAILLGAVGGPKWDDLPVSQRPEKALLDLRKECELYANLRPIRVYPSLVEGSPLKNELASGADLLIVRELIGGLYFSLPRGIEGAGQDRRGFNTLSYSTSEIARITEVAVESARKRSGRVTSVDKANVLESSKLWREVVEENVPEELDLNHLYVDNAAMQFILDPNQFDVVVTSNMFGDILSDLASQISGSIGLLPSASLGDEAPGMYEPVHGSAPDIAGEDKANPLAMILSLAMALRYNLEAPDWAGLIEQAVDNVVATGRLTPDLADADKQPLTTNELGEAVLSELKKLEEE